MPIALTILGLALVVDWLSGEYPAVVHPVVWLGKLITCCLRLAPASGWWRQFLFGGLLTVVLVGLSAGLAWLVVDSCCHPLMEVLVGAFLLKASFALRALGAAALGVVRPLEAG